MTSALVERWVTGWCLSRQMSWRRDGESWLAEVAAETRSQERIAASPSLAGSPPPCRGDDRLRRVADVRRRASCVGRCRCGFSRPRVRGRSLPLSPDEVSILQLFRLSLCATQLAEALNVYFFNSPLRPSPCPPTFFSLLSSRRFPSSQTIIYLHIIHPRSSFNFGPLCSPCTPCLVFAHTPKQLKIPIHYPTQTPLFILIYILNLLHFLLAN